MIEMKQEEANTNTNAIREESTSLLSIIISLDFINKNNLSWLLLSNLLFAKLF